MIRIVCTALVVALAFGTLAETGLAQTGYYQRFQGVAPARWKFGVAVRNTNAGCVITRVEPGSAAARAGFGVGDTVMSVSGTLVGYVRGRLYDISDVMNNRADGAGRVTMKVLDGDTRRVTRVVVQLDPNLPKRPPLPRPPIIVIPKKGPGFAGRNTPFRTIQRWYAKYLGRVVTPRDVPGWLGAVASGQMELRDVRVGILSSSEYFDRCRNSPSVWVATMFRQVVGREPTTNELRVWTPKLYRTYRGDRGRFTRAFLRAYGKY